VGKLIKNKGEKRGGKGPNLKKEVIKNNCNTCKLMKKLS
jgi:hypothetical protein